MTEKKDGSVSVIDMASLRTLLKSIPTADQIFMPPVPYYNVIYIAEIFSTCDVKHAQQTYN